MRRTFIATAIVAAVVATASPAPAAVDAQRAFERIKGLEGLWKGMPEGQGEEAEAEAAAITEVIHRFEVSAAGTIVMETMQPDTEHEMINMYFLDGDDLVLTHYCSGGNQPRMRLDRDTSTEAELVFDFDGGTNLEGADHHIHSANLKLSEGGGLESRWFAAAGGEIVGGMTFHLNRAAAE